MRKLILAALFVLALACFAGASIAYAGDCGGCKTKCHSCKPKCESPCKPKCEKPCGESKCNSCKPKCEKPCGESMCNSCKPKCNPCGESKCHSCKPKCNPCGESKCHSCKPKCNPCGDPCGSCVQPYNGYYSADLSAGACCGNFGICGRPCMTCETKCERVETVDPCTGCVKVDYVYRTECHEIERPRVIPWWFNEKGAGNIYPDMMKEEKAAEEAPAE